MPNSVGEALPVATHSPPHGVVAMDMARAAAQEGKTSAVRLITDLVNVAQRQAKAGTEHCPTLAALAPGEQPFQSPGWQYGHEIVFRDRR